MRGLLHLDIPTLITGWPQSFRQTSYPALEVPSIYITPQLGADKTINGLRPSLVTGRLVVNIGCAVSGGVLYEGGAELPCFPGESV